MTSPSQQCKHEFQQSFGDEYICIKCGHKEEFKLREIKDESKEAKE